MVEVKIQLVCSECKLKLTTEIDDFVGRKLITCGCGVSSVIIWDSKIEIQKFELIEKEIMKHHVY